MKVLFYTPVFANKGGIERLLSYLCDYFTNIEKFNISIIHEDAPRKLYYSFPEKVKIYSRNLTPFDSEAELRLRNLVKKINPDVTVAMCSSRHLYKLPRALIGTEYPVVLSEHNTEEYIAGSLYNDYTFYNAIRRVCDYNHVIFNDFTKHFPDDILYKLSVIENPIFSSDNYASMELNGTENYIIHIGRYDLWQKRQDILVKSFAKIAKDYPNWKVLAYGPDWKNQRRGLEKLINENKLEHQFHLMGSTDDVYGVLKKGKIFAFPSKYEAFGLSVGEALSVGLPVVAFEECQGVNRLVKHQYNGLLVPGIDDDEAFAYSLKNLIDSEELRLQLSNNAIESIKEHSPESFFSKWKNLLDEASGLKGCNRLLNLSDIEKDYINLVVSGYLYDMRYRETKKFLDLQKWKNRFESRRLFRLAKKTNRLLWRFLKIGIK